MKETTAAAVMMLVFAAVLAGCGGPSTEKQIEQGVSQFQVGELDQAKETLTRILRGDPSNPKALFYLGRVHYAQGSFELAAYYFQCTVDSDPSFPEARKLLKESQERAGSAGPGLRFIPEPAKNVVSPPKSEESAPAE